MYILLCDNKVFYVGITNDIKNRINKHKNGKSFFTSKFFNIILVYFEKFPQKTIAVKREKQIKGWTREKKINLIKGNL